MHWLVVQSTVYRVLNDCSFLITINSVSVQNFVFNDCGVSSRDASKAPGLRGVHFHEASYMERFGRI